MTTPPPTSTTTTTVPNDGYLQSFKNTLLSNAHAMAEAVVPVLAVSRFAEKGVLTPSEFVEAGDVLVLKCPTWQWAAGDADKRRTYLPANKQYLITRGVPSRLRVRDLEKDVDGDDHDAGDGWLATHDSHVSTLETYVDENPTPLAKSTPAPAAAVVDDEYIDVDAFEEANLSSGDASTAKTMPKLTSSPHTPGGGGNDSNDNDEQAIVKTRTYDLSITYDKYYQTPRMWLYGYSEAGVPLPPIAAFDDISADHANKTATIEAHPHTGAQCVSIHPCRHAQILKKMYDSLATGGADNTTTRVEQALIIFLKFMNAIIPTIAYDWTMEVRLGQDKKKAGV